MDEEGLEINPLDVIDVELLECERRDDYKPVTTREDGDVDRPI